MKPELVLVGGGGHCKSCIDVIETADEFRIKGIVDVSEKVGGNILNYDIFATDNDLPQLIKDGFLFFITLGQVKSPALRTLLFRRIKSLGGSFPTIVSPLAYVSKHARVDEGSIVMHRAIVNAAARIGKNCIVNTKALVEHDAVVEDFCHIATAALVNGGVRVSQQTFIGSNTTTREYTTIGRNSVIGGGSLIMNDAPDYSLKNNGNDPARNE